VVPIRQRTVSDDDGARQTGVQGGQHRGDFTAERVAVDNRSVLDNFTEERGDIGDVILEQVPGL
jgi:hypothetical protein